MYETRDIVSSAAIAGVSVGYVFQVMLKCEHIITEVFGSCWLPVLFVTPTACQSSSSYLLPDRQVPASLQQGHPRELSRGGQGISLKLVLGLNNTYQVTDTNKFKNTPTVIHPQFLSHRISTDKHPLK